MTLSKPLLKPPVRMSSIVLCCVNKYFLHPPKKYPPASSTLMNGSPTRVPFPLLLLLLLLMSLGTEKTLWCICFLGTRTGELAGQSFSNSFQSQFLWATCVDTHLCGHQLEPPWLPLALGSLTPEFLAHPPPCGAACENCGPGAS